jgi:hypothetical protein
MTQRFIGRNLADICAAGGIEGHQLLVVTVSMGERVVGAIEVLGGRAKVAGEEVACGRHVAALDVVLLQDHAVDAFASEAVDSISDLVPPDEAVSRAFQYYRPSAG